MSSAQAVVPPSDAASLHIAWIEAHLVRLGQGHDPFGHLFAIERLARAARADLWDAQQAHQPRRRQS